MIDVVLLCAEEEICGNFSQQSLRQQVHFESTQSLRQTMKLIDSNQPDAVLIIDGNFENLQSSVDEISEQSDIPILVAAPRSDKLMELWTDRVYDIITLPVLQEEFWFWFGRIATTLSGGSVLGSRAAMQGKLQDISAIDLVQMLEGRGKSAIIQLVNGTQKGRIWIQDGSVQSAELREFGQVEAVLHLLAWQEGKFSVSFEPVEIIKTIELENEQILLEAAQRIDKRNKLLAYLPGVNETLLISPEVDLFQNKSRVSSYLKFFQGGRTINALLQEFDVDELILLEQVYDFIHSKKLMTREQFDRYHTAYEKESETQGVKNTLRKWFGKKNKPRARIRVERDKKPKAKSVPEAKAAAVDDGQIIENVLLADHSDLNMIRNLIQDL